jgi:hypothetical protein
MGEKITWTYGKAGPEREVLVDWRAVDALEVRERPVVGVVDEDGVAVDVFWDVSKATVKVIRELTRKRMLLNLDVDLPAIAPDSPPLFHQRHHYRAAPAQVAIVLRHVEDAGVAAGGKGVPDAHRRPVAQVVAVEAAQRLHQRASALEQTGRQRGYPVEEQGAERVLDRPLDVERRPELISVGRTAEQQIQLDQQQPQLGVPGCLLELGVEE